MRKNDNSKTTFCASDLEQNISDGTLATEKTARHDTRCRLHLHSRRHKLADADGVSAKAAIDGLVHAGILRDDSTKYVKEVTNSQEKIRQNEIEETIITITQI